MDAAETPPLLHRHFLDQARRTPDAVAIRYKGQDTSYRELSGMSAAVASALTGAGIGPGALVGLHLDRSVDWVAAMLGILRVGAAVVPLPPAYPPARLASLVDHAEVDLVLDSESTPLDRGTGTPIRSLETIFRTGAEEERDVPEISGDPLAFVLSSSGSTGRPKMIARTHRSFFHRLGWTWDRHPYAPGEIGCQKAHITTTHAIYELFEPLLRGTPSLILPDDTVRNLEVFWAEVRVEGVTRLLMVPSALRASLDIPDLVPADLRVLVLMGEYVDPALAERVVHAFPLPTSVYSIYGSTEASSTLVTDLHRDLRPGEELPLGRPISPEVRPLVLAGDLDPVPPGGTGRLYMAGPALFQGYFRSPDETAAAFVHPPTEPEPVFDTRDEVRLRPDGNLEFMGRTDHTVKIRGFRVSTTEVERALGQHPEVNAAAVVVDDTAPGGAALVGIVTPQDLDVAPILAFLRQTLPGHMVPSRLIARGSMPLTASAKVDRVRLLEELRSVADKGGASAFRGSTESAVAEAWREVLGHDQFERGTSFFEAGGTSLNVFHLVHLLRGAGLATPETLREEHIYLHPVLHEMAARLEARRTLSVPSGSKVPAVEHPVCVTLRSGPRDQTPLFLVPSAGGTVGVYGRLVKALATPREVIGLRDPFLWGGRDLTGGFDDWVDRFVSAIRERVPAGPHHLLAYSSAGAFGLEIARRLAASAPGPGSLTLVDPLALDRGSRNRFGHWALEATWSHPLVRKAIRWAGRLRTPLVRVRNAVVQPSGQRWVDWSAGEVRALEEEVLSDSGHLASVAALMALDSGQPLAISEDEIRGLPPEARARAVVEGVRSFAPEVDPDRIERILTQYQFQVRTQHRYQLRPFGGDVLLVEPETPYAGLIEILLRPYLPRLRAARLPLGPADDGTAGLTARFGALEAHYRCMRDDRFVEGLAALIEGRMDPSVRG